MPARSPSRAALALTVVLALIAGAVDAICILRLGQVFASVITGNLVLAGVSAGQADGSLAAHVGVAVGGFAAGVVAGSVLAGAPPGEDAPRRPVWGPRVSLALAAELACLGALLGWWVAAGGQGRGGGQLGQLALATVAMGVQSGAVRAIGIPGLSTTYMTGTLTSALSVAVTTGRLRWPSFALIAAVVGGAAVSSVLLRYASTWAPALPAGLLVVVLAAAAGLSRRPAAGPGSRPG